MKSSIYVKRQSFEIRLNSVISFVFVAFCQPRILRYSARDVTNIFAIMRFYNNLPRKPWILIARNQFFIVLKFCVTQCERSLGQYYYVAA